MVLLSRPRNVKPYLQVRQIPTEQINMSLFEVAEHNPLKLRPTLVMTGHNLPHGPFHQGNLIR